MNVPSLPTDNLYKFMAIFGLLILLTSTYVLIKETDKINTFNSEVIGVSDKLESFLIRVDSTRNLRRQLMKDSLNYKNPTFGVVIEEEEYLSREIDKMHSDFNSRVERIKWVEARYDFIKEVFGFSSIISMLLIGFGFGQWYYKHQRYIDAEMKLEGEKILKKIKNRKSEKSK